MKSLTETSLFPRRRRLTVDLNLLLSGTVNNPATTEDHLHGVRSGHLIDPVRRQQMASTIATRAMAV